MFEGGPGAEAVAGMFFPRGKSRFIAPALEAGGLAVDARGDVALQRAAGSSATHEQFLAFLKPTPVTGLPGASQQPREPAVGRAAEPRRGGLEAWPRLKASMASRRRAREAAEKSMAIGLFRVASGLCQVV
eukprot:CAMPEP_0119260488 /NCGR_PEP_ID=MMETSP1329-20130426/847_1 /TAXON_ID=114041 /ORGANISM="Genus nov. species nov., Strain RCC1024" /LENGTH=130 /DNA_ID=CAMNT_0007259911 /DNA_START=262 /DNA_END=656 /DNA_ORIENTATION=-